MKKFNILIFTSGRSDFDLLLPIVKKIKKIKSIRSELLVSGSHLSKKHGLTLNYVKKQNVGRLITININCGNVNENNLSKTFANAQTLYSKFFSSLKKKIDLTVVLGDRYEALAFASSCFFSKIPIAHIHGGEKTNGAMDDIIRHTITKLSNLHFVSNVEHKKRVLQLGENKSNVLICGLLGYENISNIKIKDKKTLEKKLQISFKNKIILISYHSVTTISNKQNTYQFREVLNALKNYNKCNIIFTSPNIDPGNIEIIEMINNFIEKNENAYFYKSLGQELFFSLAKNSDIFIGNSSSGILEVPFLKVPVINIGKRQAGRYQFVKVSNISPITKKIIREIDKILNQKRKKIPSIRYQKKNVSSFIIKNILKKLRDKNNTYLSNKIFNDLNN
jgi:UDP-hydrolysing UDP-N-acetyl-D-glucosamine 2-epimerase